MVRLTAALVLLGLGLITDVHSTRIVTHSPRSRTIVMASDQPQREAMSSGYVQSGITRGSFSVQHQVEMEEAVDIHANYEVSVNKNCVAIDLMDKIISSITCSNHSLMLTFDTAAECSSDAVCSANAAYTKWNESTILNGGFQWGCFDQAGEYTIIMGQIVSMELINVSTLAVQTSDVGGLACFETLVMNMGMNHTFPVEKSTSEAFAEVTIGGELPSSNISVHRFHTLSNGQITFRRSVIGIFDKNDEIVYTWTENGWGYAPVYFNLYSDVFGLDRLYARYSCPIESHTCTMRLPADLPIGPRYYFDIDWSDAGDCTLGLFGQCCLRGCKMADHDADFFVRGNAVSRVTIPNALLDWDCSKCSAPIGGTVPSSVACASCQLGYQSIQARAICTNCWVEYSFMTYDLQINLFEELVSIQVEGKANLNLDYTIDVAFELQSRVVIPLPRRTLANWMGQLVGFNFEIKLDMGIVLTNDMNLTGAASARGRQQGLIELGGQMRIQRGQAAQFPQGKFVQTGDQTFEVSETGVLSQSFGILASLDVNLVNVFLAQLSIEPYVQAEVSAAYNPAFPALDAPSSRWNADSRSATYKTGDCDKPHVLRRQFGWGVRNNRLSAAIRLGSLVNWERSVDNLANLQGLRVITSGCFAYVNAPSNPVITLPLLFTTSLNFTSLSSRFGLVLDVATALNLLATRVAFINSSQITMYGNPYTQVFITILPSTNPNTIDTQALRQTLGDQSINPNSALRQGHIGQSMITVPTPRQSSSTGGSAEGPADELDDMSNSSNSGISTTVITIIAACAGGVILLFVVIGILCFVRTRRLKRDQSCVQQVDYEQKMKGIEMLHTINQSISQSNSPQTINDYAYNNHILGMQSSAPKQQSVPGYSYNTQVNAEQPPHNPVALNQSINQSINQTTTYVNRAEGQPEPPPALPPRPR